MFCPELNDPKNYTSEYRDVLKRDDPHQAIAFFENQASVYDSCMSTLGFTDPAVVRTYLKESGIPPEAEILEFACGTGLVG